MNKSKLFDREADELMTPLYNLNLKNFHLAYILRQKNVFPVTLKK